MLDLASAYYVQLSIQKELNENTLKISFPHPTSFATFK
jgi:hypothetical protein